MWERTYEDAFSLNEPPTPKYHVLMHVAYCKKKRSYTDLSQIILGYIIICLTKLRMHSWKEWFPKLNNTTWYLIIPYIHQQRLLEVNRLPLVEVIGCGIALKKTLNIIITWREVEGYSIYIARRCMMTTQVGRYSIHAVMSNLLACNAHSHNTCRYRPCTSTITCLVP